MTDTAPIEAAVVPEAVVAPEVAAPAAEVTPGYAGSPPSIFAH